MDRRAADFHPEPIGDRVGTVGYGASKTGMALSVVADGNYITTLAEVGIPGVLLMIALAISVLAVLIAPLRNNPNLSPLCALSVSR
jgi:O-antigen ligase